MKSEASIILFLNEMREIVTKNGVIFVPREQNIQFIADVNTSIEQIKELMLSLEPDECFDGPEADRDPKYSEKWTVAEFSPTFCGIKLYLKLSINMTDQRCKCISVKPYTERTEA